MRRPNGGSIFSIESLTTVEEAHLERPVWPSQVSDSTCACECKGVELEEDMLEAIAGVASLGMAEPVVYHTDCMVENVPASIDTWGHVENLQVQVRTEVPTALEVQREDKPVLIHIGYRNFLDQSSFHIYCKRFVDTSFDHSTGAIALV